MNLQPPSLPKLELPPTLQTQLSTLLLRKEADQLAEPERLIDFVLRAWPLIDPHPLVRDYYLDAICEHLEGFRLRWFNVLLINIPPRFAKTTICSILYPAHVWAKDPAHQFMCLSYAERRSVDAALKNRRLLESDWYQDRWPLQLLDDQNTRNKFVNDKGGHRFTSSFDGPIRGEGGDSIMIDDPHDLDGVESDTERQAVLDKYDDEVTGRLNDRKTGGICLIMQRLHEDDLTGHIKERRPNAVHLKLPHEFEARDRCVTVKLPATPDEPWKDWRTEEGQLLAPNRIGPEELADIKIDTTAYGYAGQHQQRPAPAGGGIFAEGWFKNYYDELPDGARRCFLSADTANKVTVAAAWSVIGEWWEYAGNYYLENVVRAKWKFEDLVSNAKALAEEADPNAFLIEDKGSGVGLIRILHTQTRFAIIPIKVKNNEDKPTRATNTTHIWAAGRVFLKRNATWLKAYVDEHLVFPNSSFSDQVDMTSQFFNWIAPKGRRRRRPRVGGRPFTSHLKR